MVKVVVVGGGLAGCAAAAAAAKAGASVTLLERMDVLGGLGLLTGMVDRRHFCVKEEIRLMGGYDVFQVIDKCYLHDIHLPWPKPDGATHMIFDVIRLDSELQKYLRGIGVEVRLMSRAKDVEMDGRAIKAVILDDKSKIEGNVFVDTTGGAGPMASCQRYGNGCAMCILRCPAFGDRVSIAQKAGVKELMGKRLDGSIGPMSAAYSLLKESLAPQLRDELERVGYVIVPMPKELINYKRTESITASGNIDKGFAENVVLLDNGYAKRIAAGYTPLSELNKVPGLERARYADPYAGGIGNAIRFQALTPRDDTLSVPGIENLFVASEKLGVNGVPEVIITGVLAGHNAVRRAAGRVPLVLSKTTMMGAFIAFINERWNTEEGLTRRFCLWRGPFFQKAKEAGLYAEDKNVLRSRIEKEGLEDVFSRKIVS